jgi:hypothetical protein
MPTLVEMPAPAKTTILSESLIRSTASSIVSKSDNRFLVRMLDGVIDLARSGRMPAMRSNDGEPAKGDVMEGRLGRRTGDFGAEKAML